MQIFDWHYILGQLTPSHLFVGLVFYLIVHGAAKLAMFLGLVTRGIIVSDTRRAIHYVHGLQKHPQSIRECIVGDCHLLRLNK